MTLEVLGRTAIVTGAAAGIGRALALEAARAGMTVAICDVAADGLAETASLLRDAGAEVLSRTVDVRDAAALRSFADACSGLPEIAMVWANAGVLHRSSTLEPDLEKWAFVLDVNLKGAIYTMAAFVPLLLAQNRPAQFIFTGSLASFVAAPEIGCYVASKHALWGLADTLRIELAEAGAPVGVSLFTPQRVATDIIAASVEKARQSGGEEGVRSFLTGLPTPEQVAGFAWQRAVAGDALILPDPKDAAPMLQERLTQLADVLGLQIGPALRHESW